MLMSCAANSDLQKICSTIINIKSVMPVVKSLIPVPVMSIDFIKLICNSQSTDGKFDSYEASKWVICKFKRQDFLFTYDFLMVVHKDLCWCHDNIVINCTTLIFSLPMSTTAFICLILQ